MRNRRRVLRALCSVLAVWLLIVCLSLREDETQVIVLSAEAQTASCGKAAACADTVRRSAMAVPYITDAAMGELHALIEYAGGENPTADKAIGDKGQNTKRNTATTLIDIVRQTRPASSFYFKLLPYGSDPDVWEVCAFYTPLFRRTEQIVHTGMLHNYRTQTISRADGTGILGIGYDFNFAFDTYYAASDPWQRNFGFCRLYDAMAFLIGDYCETIRVPFRYDDKDWMIQIWKGVYNNNMLGAEIGVYNKPTDREAEFYDCAADPDRVEMSFSVYLDDEFIVETPHETSWWQTAFTYHSLTKPSNLTMRADLTFKNAQIAALFADSLREQNADVQVHRSGRDVSFLWAP